MTRRAAASAQNAVSLFPFLAVLLCTMGALILLLIVIARQAADQRERAEAGAAPQVDAEKLAERRDELSWQIEHLADSRRKTAEQLAEQRAALSHLEEHSQRLRSELAELELAEKLLAGRSTFESADREKLAAELEAMRRRAAEIEKLLAEAAAKGRKPPAFAVVPFDGENGTRRRPIYIECRGDAVILQPEGITFRESDFAGSLGPSNPLAACLRVAAENLARSQKLNVGEQPYPLLLVRPDGIGSYYAARAAMGSWDSDFGYELIDADWPLEFPQADPQLAQLLARTQAEARMRQDLIARAAPSLQPSEKLSFHPAPDGDAEGTSGSGSGRYAGRGGSAVASARRNQANADADRYRDSLGSGGPGATGNGGFGGTGVPGGGNPGTNSFGGEPIGPGNSTGSTGVAGNGPYADGSYANGSSGNGPNGTSLTNGGLPNSTQFGGNGAAGSGASGDGMPGNGQPGGEGGPELGGGPQLFAANEGASSVTADSGSSMGSTPGGAASTGGTPSTGGRYGSANGDPSGASGSPGSPNTTGPGGQSASYGGAGSQQAGGANGPNSAGGPSGSASASAGSPGASAGAGSPSSGGGSPGSGSPSLSYTAAPPPGSEQPTVAEMQQASSRRLESLAKQRGENWGLPESAHRATPLTRPVQIYCAADRLTVFSDRGVPDRQINLGPRTEDSVDDLVSTVWSQIESWGLAGRGMYWRPVLSVHVAPDGVARFEELQALLAGSGLDVTGKPITSSPSAATARRP